jgi:O-antigen/teichoic acid export membrane protein
VANDPRPSAVTPVEASDEEGRAVPSGGDSSDSLARNAFFGLASQIATASFTAVITLFLVRTLDPSGYGVFVLALGFAGLVAWPADFGVTMSAARFIAERRDDRAAVAGVLVQALKIKLVVSSGIALLLIVLAEPIASVYGQPALAWPLRAVAIALVAQNLVYLFANVFVALGRIQSQFLLYVTEGAMEATATIALVLVFGGATAAAFGRAIGYLFGALVGILIVFRLVGRRAIAERRDAPPLRRLASYAGVMMVIDAANAIYFSADVLLVGALLGTAAAGIYSAPLKILALLHYPGLAATQAIAPKMAIRPGVEPDVLTFARGLRYLIVLQTAIAVVVAVWAVPITHLLLGSAFAESAQVLRALSPAIFLWGIGPLVSTSVNYRGEARRRVPIVVGCMLLNVALLLALIRPVGVVGAAVSVDVSYAAYVLAHMWICRGLFGIGLKSVAGICLRAIPAATAMAVVLSRFGEESLSVVDWIVGLASSVVAYIVLILGLRVISINEARDLLGAIGRGLRRGTPAEAR